MTRSDWGEILKDVGGDRCQLVMAEASQDTFGLFGTLMHEGRTIDVKVDRKKFASIDAIMAEAKRQVEQAIKAQG